MQPMRIARINHFILYRETAGIFYCEEYRKHMNTAARTKCRVLLILQHMVHKVTAGKQQAN